MEYLKLKFKNARLIREKNLKNMLGSNRFFHPINKMHVYNSVCVLLDRTPTPQLRDVDTKYMPFYQDILDVVDGGFIKINSLSDSECLTTIKKGWNSGVTGSSQYTWKDCRYAIGTLYPIFLNRLTDILKYNEDNITEIGFDDIILEIQSMGVIGSDDVIVYSNDMINELIAWCRVNSATTISNYIENKQESSRPTGFGKRVHRGNVNTSKYSGIIYIPLTESIYDELINYTKGFSNILDGGLVTIVSYGEIKEDDLIDFTEIRNLNPTRKFMSLMNKGVDWSNTIYKDLNPNNLTKDINKIIKEVGISIKDYQKEYDEMMKKISKVKFTTNKIGDVAYKLNYFIEECINKEYQN